MYNFEDVQTVFTILLSYKIFFISTTLNEIKKSSDIANYL